MNTVGVLIVDDHQIVREGLRAVMSGLPHLRIVGEAADGDDAWRQSLELRPDIVVMDLSMPRMNGADATRRITAAQPGTRVVAFTAREEPPYVRDLLSSGARGYVLKRSAIASLLTAIAVVGEGGFFLDPGLAHRPSCIDKDAPLALEELSAREVEVASLAVRGYANAEIGATLKISVKTVESHKARLMSKLGLRRRAQLVRYAMYRGWLSP